ncbi:MAG: hypothetical protein HRT44_06005, partial [Bdellovibrionales bacterium]|nr:hypothetical protein [Bdellovibrionales bacterium]
MKIRSVIFLIILGLTCVHCGVQNALNSDQQSSSLSGGSDTVAGTAPEAQNSCDDVPMNFCPQSEISVTVVDDNGCEVVLCAPPTSQTQPTQAQPQNQQQQQQQQSSGSSASQQPAGQDSMDNDDPEFICERVHMGGGVYRDLSSRDGFVNRYIASIGTHNPRGGRYAAGVAMFCERQNVRCLAGGRISGRGTGARHIVDRDGSKCNAALFAGR